MPRAYGEFEAIATRLEDHYQEMQDVEFTIEKGKLWMLQTRDGKRTAQAAVKIAVDMVEEGLITKEEALMRISPDQVDFFLHPQFDQEGMAEAGSAQQQHQTTVQAQGCNKGGKGKKQGKSTCTSKAQKHK